MMTNEENAKNKTVITALRGIVNGIGALELINEENFSKLSLAVDSLSFYNEKRDKERYSLEIDKFNKLYQKIVPEE